MTKERIIVFAVFFVAVTFVSITNAGSQNAAKELKLHGVADPAKVDWKALPDDYWKKMLDAQTFKVCRKSGTEPAFSGKYADSKSSGIYYCSSCGQALYSSETKFDSGTGWPSFNKPLPNAVIEKKEGIWGFNRTEVSCSRCSAHLGHVFPDGPPPTGLRYCINSVCLQHQ